MPNPTEPLNELEETTERSKLPPLTILRMLYKRKGLALTVWLLGTAIAIFVVRALPPVYKAEAVILVDSQKIPTTFVSPTVNGDITDRLALITQSIMTSASLLKIINRYNLYSKERKHLTDDELLAKMRKDVSVSFEKSWTGDRGNIFHITYEGRSAKVVADVANRLAGLYVAENTHARERQAQSTVAFLDRQLRDAKASLDEQERKVARFKEEHNGTLPEQQNSLLGNLSSLTVQLQGDQESIDRAQESKSLLQAALSSAESAEETLRANLRAVNGPDGTPKLKSDVLKAKLRKLRLQYTSDYPEVQSVEQELVEAEREEAAAALQAPGQTHSKNGKPAGKAVRVVSPEVVHSKERIANLRAQIEVKRHELNSLEQDRARTVNAITEIKARISRLPLVEQQMASLKRNYDESEKNYNSLLQRQLAAGVANDLERSRESEQFTIVDPAHPPDKPVKPKRPLLAAGGSIGSLIIGLLIGFALEFRKRTFLGEWELPPGTVVLGRVPVIHAAR